MVSFVIADTDTAPPLSEKAAGASAYRQEEMKH